MKTNKQSILGLGVLIMIVLFSCQKDNAEDTDYRTVFTGNYIFTVKTSYYNIDTGGSNDTHETLGFVRKCTSSDESQYSNWAMVTDSTLVVNYGEDSTFIHLEPSGDFKYFSHISGRFVGTDSLFFTYPDYQNSAGQGSNTSVYGKKI